MESNDKIYLGILLILTGILGLLNIISLFGTIIGLGICQLIIGIVERGKIKGDEQCNFQMMK